MYPINLNKIYKILELIPIKNIIIQNLQQTILLGIKIPLKQNQWKIFKTILIKIHNLQNIHHKIIQFKIIFYHKIRQILLFFKMINHLITEFNKQQILKTIIIVNK